MKKIILLVAVMFVMSSGMAFAECDCGMCAMKGGKGMKGEGWGEKKGEMLQEKLGLSDDQAAQVQELSEKKHAAMKQAQEDFKAGLDAILTDEQKAEHEKMMEHRGEMKEHRKEMQDKMGMGGKDGKGSPRDKGDTQ